MNIVDLVFIIILAVAGLAGLRRGLIGAVLGLLGVLAALVAGYFYTAPVVTWLENNWQVVTHLARVVARTIRLPETVADLSLVGVTLEQLVEKIESLPISLAYRQAAVARISEGLDGLRAETLGELVYRSAANFMVSALVFITLFALVRLLVNLLAGLLATGITTTPLGMVNALLGGVFGLLQAGLILTLVTAILSPLLSSPALGAVSAEFTASRLAHYFLDLYYLISSKLIMTLTTT